MQERDNTAKAVILEFLDFLRFKIENDALTLSEAQSIAKVIEEQMDLTGTISDFSGFYEQSPGNVRAVIARKVFAKPRRQVLYPFRAFRKVIPRTWKKIQGGGKN